MQNRREFIKKATIGTSLLLVGGFPYSAFGTQEKRSLCILHTNDVHSRLEPFPMDGSPLQGLGGVAARKTFIDNIRKEEEQLLLLDAGDMFQGTSYFNFYYGEPEVKAMSLLGYDAGTLGNHEFDAGIDNLAVQISKANFPFLMANYDASKTVLQDKIQKYKIFQKGKLKVGVFGLGIELYGLVPDFNYKNIKYLDPVTVAQSISRYLKRRQGCDMVICLSHLGFQYNSNKVSDCVIARRTEYIDLIIGGHTHTFLDVPHIEINQIGKKVLINQVGWGGAKIGKLNFEFDRKNNVKHSNLHTVIPMKQTIG